MSEALCSCDASEARRCLNERVSDVRPNVRVKPPVEAGSVSLG